MSDEINVRHFAHALSAWARSPQRGWRASGSRGDYQSVIRFHWRPDPRAPESHVTFEATLVDDRPVIRLTTSEPSPSNPEKGQRVVVPIVSKSDASESSSRGRDPNAICEACGAVGTIGRAVRTNGAAEPTEIHRFCANCWVEQSARYRARWTEEDRLRTERFMRQPETAVSGAGPGMFFEAATWHGPLETVRDIERALRESVNLAPQDLDRVADEIRRAAPELDGEMPFEVEGFLQRFGT